MKKLLVVTLLLIGFSGAQIKLQAQFAPLGVGYGLGLGTEIVPLILDIGLEGSQFASPVINSKGSYHDDGTGAVVPYDGKIKLNTTRVGGYLSIHLPGLNLVPIVSAFSNPVLHFGTQRLNMAIEGEVRLADNGGAIADNIIGQGSYFMVGFPTYLGPFFIEPAFGTQHIFVPDYANYKNTPDFQLSAGVSF